MSQKITITIDGKDGIVRPDSALKILELVFKTLQSIDSETWAIGTRRLEWRVSDASLKDPFALTYTADVRTDVSIPPDVVRLFIEGCKEIDEVGHFPPFFTVDDVERMADVGKMARDYRRLEFQNTQFSHLVTPSRLRDNARELLDNPDRVFSHGSLEGILGSLQNFPDRSGASVVIVPRLKDHKVRCSLTPAQAEQLNEYVDRKTRVVLYGEITYENGTPKSMAVSAYRVIPSDDDLPALEAVRALPSAIPAGTSIEDFVSEMRGDD